MTSEPESVCYPINSARTAKNPELFSLRASTQQKQALHWFGFALSKIPVSITTHAHRLDFPPMVVASNQPELTCHKREGIDAVAIHLQKRFDG